jgi:hypothetical protein
LQLAFRIAQQGAELDGLGDSFSAGENRAVVNTHEHEILQRRLALGPGQNEFDQRMIEGHWRADEVLFEAAFVRCRSVVAL